MSTNRASGSTRFMFSSNGSHPPPGTPRHPGILKSSTIRNPPLSKYARSAAASRSVSVHQPTSMMYATAYFVSSGSSSVSVLTSSSCAPRKLTSFMIFMRLRSAIG